MEKPIIAEITEQEGFQDNLPTIINANFANDSGYLLAYPIVYIHGWKKDVDNPKGLYDVYVGESNDVVERTKEHMHSSADPNNWQNHLVSDGVVPKLYVIGHKRFTKSLTLDIENKLINYLLGSNNVTNVHNSRGNPQYEYYGSGDFDKIFNMIWRGLRKKNKELFATVEQIKDSAIFKASPLHKLTDDQLDAKKRIIDKVNNSIAKNKTNELIFVEGGAGTGKTVLMSSVFYDLLIGQNDSSDPSNTIKKQIRCALLVNHDEQITVYREIANKLNLFSEFGEDIVSKPTHWINTHPEGDLYDVVFVDEGHLLLTQGKQSYRGSNHLDDIMKRSRVTVLVFDENQILTTEEVWEDFLLFRKRSLSIWQKNYIHLEKQLRMMCSDTTKAFIDDLTLNQKVSSLPKDDSYEIKVFDKPEELRNAIKNKAKRKETQLSRMLATYDWDYSDSNSPNNGEKYWGVRIGNFFMPWNRELNKNLNRRQRFKNKSMAWAEQEQTINEIGSTFTIQGFDLSYAGVIIGPSVTYRNGRIVFDPSKSKNDKATRRRTLSNNTAQDFSQTLLRNELRVLLTRGVKGLYIYACDKDLRDALKKAIE